MRINKFAAAALLGISALGLSACATGLRTQVSRYQAMPAPQGQSFFVVPANAADVGGLEFSRYAELVAQQMQAQGFSRAPSIDQATMVVQVGYDVGDVHTEVVSDPFYRSPFGYWGGWGFPYEPNVDVVVRTNFEAYAEIILLTPDQAAKEPRALNAADVIARIGPEAAPPKPPGA